jgi:chemotaxis protein CheZ
VLSEKFNSILMAQGFQDLTGQVIKKVIALVQEVEERLVDLVRVASQVEELTGLVKAVEQQPSEVNKIEAEGPQIKPEMRTDVVKGQDDVDDLLSSLGF